MIRNSIVALFASVALLAGCQSADSTVAPGTISRAKFIEVYVELRMAQDVARSSSEYARTRLEILQKASVSAEDLQSFVEQHGRQVSYMAEVWDSVRARLDAPRETTSQ